MQNRCGIRVKAGWDPEKHIYHGWDPDGTQMKDMGKWGPDMKMYGTICGP
jgi:hypothetical protein